MGASGNLAASEREVVISRIFDAPRELVFKAWTDPEHIAKWYGPKEFIATVIESDVRTGGAYHFHMRGPNYDDHWKGIYREVVPPERLVFTSPAGPDSVVTLTFEDLGGKTKLTLHHVGFETVDARDLREQGWNSSLDCLADYLKVAS
jgi:uncharacterized protein YndB with AHSA1/START domain